MQDAELRRTQLELQAARDHAERWFEGAPVGLVALDTDARVVEANVAAARLLGEDPEGLVGAGFQAMFARRDVGELREHLARVARSGAVERCVLKVLRRDGRAVFVRLESVRAWPEDRGLAVRVALIDVSDRRRLERALERDRLEAQRRVDAGTSELARTNAQLQAEIRDRALAEERAHALARDLERLVEERTRELIAANRALEARATQLDAALHNLGAERAKLATVLDTVGDAILLVDADGLVVSANAAARTVFGRDPAELAGISVETLLPGARGYLDASFGGPSEVRPVKGVRGDGETRDIELGVSAFVDGGRRYTLVARDVTERQRLQQESLQARKMEAVGQLSSGIAHDFNNLLMGILGATTVARRRTSEQGPLAELLDQIHQAAMSGAAIVRQLLAFGRKQATEREPQDLSAACALAVPMLRRLLRADVRLDTDLHPGLWVDAGAGQVEQILVNLVINARDALPHGGTIRVVTEPVALAGDEARSRHVEPGGYVRLTVSDDGVGMDEEVLAHVFEPFFTTKPLGQGTGLGLSTVYSAAGQLGGQVRASSSPGKGTTFEVVLPRRPVPGTPAPAEPRTARPPEGTRRVLLVEDEILVRKTVRYYLQELGCVVVEASSGEEALRLASDHPEFELLVTDVVLPDRSGPEVASAIRDRVPGVRVVFMSAHPTDVLVGADRLRQGERSLLKPFTLEQLRESIALTAPSVARARRSRVLVVDDDAISRVLLREILEDRGCVVVEAGGVAEARRRIQEGAPDLVLTDLGLPDGRGAELVGALRAAHPSVPVLVISGRPPWDQEVRAVTSAPGVSYLSKPVDLDELEHRVGDLLGAG